MATGKWIGGVLGFITAGPLGALAGYALGSLFEHGLDAVNRDGDTITTTPTMPTAASSTTAARASAAKELQPPAEL